MSLASGKFVLRIRPELHERLKDLSRERNLSLNELCMEKLSEFSLGSLHVENANPVFPKRLIDIIRKEFPELIGLVLFGSSSRNEATESSDIDLLLVMPLGFPVSRELYRKWDRMADTFRAEFSWINKVSPHFACLLPNASDAGSLWFEIALDGKVLYQEDSNVSNFLYRLRAEMAEGKIQRQISHGHPYWIRKADDEK